VTPAPSTDAIDDLVADPAAHFGSPEDVLAAPLPLEAKRRILESWELDARRLEESADENMAGGERSHYRAVVEARRRLEEAASAGEA
jgi:hypothetical protein